MTTQDCFNGKRVYSLKWPWHIERVIVVTFIWHFKWLNVSYWTYSCLQGRYPTFSIAKYHSIRAWMNFREKASCKAWWWWWWCTFSVFFSQVLSTLLFTCLQPFYFEEMVPLWGQRTFFYYFAVIFLNGCDQCYAKVTLNEKLHVHHSLLQTHWLHWVMINKLELIYTYSCVFLA